MVIDDSYREVKKKKKSKKSKKKKDKERHRERRHSKSRRSSGPAPAGDAPATPGPPPSSPYPGAAALPPSLHTDGHSEKKKKREEKEKERERGEKVNRVSGCGGARRRRGLAGAAQLGGPSPAAPRGRWFHSSQGTHPGCGWIPGRRLISVSLRLSPSPCLAL